MRTRLFTTEAAPAGLLAQIRQLLDTCFGPEFSDNDWEHTLGGWHVVVLDGSTAVSHAACVPRLLEAVGRSFRTGYVEGVATTPARRREGLASLALAELSTLIREHFEIGALSTGCYRLYERLGWERWRGPTFARQDGELIRTEEDDDSVMVLRFGPSLGLDLDAPISCEARSGDHW